MPHQLPPEGDWKTWVILGGRGAGKTRAGAEWVRSMVEGAKPLDEGKARRVALVGETIDQVREVMVFGESGILACSPPDRRPEWQAGRKRLLWPNGAVAQVFSAHEPESLRGPQFDAAWVDEYGCAAIDKGTNQPNKFLDPKSSESTLPRYSDGRRDDLMQLQYLRAMVDYWGDEKNNPNSAKYSGRMVDMSRAHVWAWDARPHPAFPGNTELWSDGANYQRGHWLNGRVSARSLASVVREICERAGLARIDTTGLYGVVRGYVVSDVLDARSALQPLMLRFGFDAIERDGVLRFKMRDGHNPVAVDLEQVAISDDTPAGIEHTRGSAAEIAGRVRVHFVETDGDFETISEEAVLPDEATHAVSSSDLPLALLRAEGRQIAERWLTEARVARDLVKFALPPSKLEVGAGDIVSLPTDDIGGESLFRVDRVDVGAEQSIEAVRIEPQSYTPAAFEVELGKTGSFKASVPVYPLFLDVPLLSGDEVPHAPFLAVTGKPWPGSVAVYASDTDNDYELIHTVNRRSIIGLTETVLPWAPAGRVDRATSLELKLRSGQLESITHEAMLAGGNVAAIGDGTSGNWEIIQFEQADLIGNNTYVLKNLLRGQFGSDAIAPQAWGSGSWFVLLDGRPEQIPLRSAHLERDRHFRIGPARHGYSDPSYRHSIELFEGVGLRPYSPCHLRSVKKPNGNIEISWIRRTRIDGDRWSKAEVPLGEETESYKIQVLQGGVKLRQTTVSSPAWTYTEDMQSADGVTGLVEVKISQISARFGPGGSASVIV